MYSCQLEKAGKEEHDIGQVHGIEILALVLVRRFLYVQYDTDDRLALSIGVSGAVELES